MTTQPRISEGLLIGISALPLVYLAAIWNKLPAQVPIHFGPSGQPDDYASRSAFAGGLVLFAAISYALLRSLPKLDPTRNLMALSYARIRFTLTLFLTGLAVILLYIVQTGITGSIVLDLVLSVTYLLFAAIGNVMLNVPRNYFVGIRAPWALASEANWRKTHRMAGKLWVAGGVLAFVVNLLVPLSLKVSLTLAVTFTLALVPYLYSYRLFKQGLAGLLLLTLAGLTNARAQTQETMTYAITQPAGASLTLEGTLTLPATTNRGNVPVILLIAGSGPTDREGNSPALPGKMDTYRQLADSLTKRGLAVLRYDKRLSGTNLLLAGMRLSQQPLSLDYEITDAVGFIRQLQADKRFSKVIVAGHSVGSLVGMLAAAQAGAGGFVSIAGAGQNMADVLKTQFADSGLQGEALTLANRQIDSLRAGMRVTPSKMTQALFPPVNQPYWSSWMAYDPAVSLKAYKGPVLLIQGNHDIQVSVAEAERLKAARPDARLVIVDGMNHVMKPGPTDRAANIASYTAPGSTVLPAVPDAIAQFAFAGK